MASWGGPESDPRQQWNTLDALAHVHQAEEEARLKRAAPGLGNGPRLGRVLAWTAAIALFAWFAIVFGRLALMDPEPDPELEGFTEASLKPPWD